MSQNHLDNLFKEKIFRIPDYQRGYAWQKSQLKDFWEDLIKIISAWVCKSIHKRIY